MVQNQLVNLLLFIIGYGVGFFLGMTLLYGLAIVVIRAKDKIYKYRVRHLRKIGKW